MRFAELETWTLRVVDRALAGQPVEDARVELKTAWPDPAKAARRIAAHANAAGGDRVLWVIGVDEKARTVPGAPVEEQANWWQSVQTFFDELPPDMQSIVVPTSTAPVVALLFATERAPFVVRNPARGQAGENIEREVPWRDGTRTRSAHRSELLRLLVPQLLAPVVDVLSAEASTIPEEQTAGSLAPFFPDGYQRWQVAYTLYVAPRTRDRVVIPFHTLRCTVVVPEVTPVLVAPEVSLRPYWQPDSGLARSATVIGSTSEVLIDGPGMLLAEAVFSTPVWYDLPNDRALDATLTLVPVDTREPATVTQSLLPVPSGESRTRKWALNRPRPARTGPGGTLLPPLAEY